jgi:hypothetical protein
MKGFRVHVLVEDHQLREVAQVAVLRLPLQPQRYALQDFALVRARRAQVRQGKIPARAVRDLRGVVERVRACQY